MVAKERLHYGLVSCRYDAESDKYILDKTPENDKLKKIFSHGGDYRKWKSIQWYSYDGGAIKDLNDDAIDLLLDFKASSHAKKILTILTNR
jgi:hypothetical protein